MRNTGSPGSEEGANELVRQTVSSGAERVLYAGPIGALYRSPDGEMLAFVEEDENEARLNVMPSSGGEPVTLLTAPVTDQATGGITEFRGVMWSPGGDELLVMRQPWGGEEASPTVTLWRVPLDGADAIEVAGMRLPASESGYVGAWNYSLHPAGSLIAFERHAGFLAQTWAIDDLMAFIRSEETVSVIAAQR